MLFASACFQLFLEPNHNTSAVPRPQTLVDAGIGIMRSFGSSDLVFHGAHAPTKRPPPGIVDIFARRTQVVAVVVVARAPAGVKASVGVFASGALPDCYGHLLC